MTSRDKFQGLCLKSDAGYRHMDRYDKMPKDVRLRLQSSTYNLCAACVQDISDNYPPHYHEAIDRMEAELRAQEARESLSLDPLTK